LLQFNQIVKLMTQ